VTEQPSQTAEGLSLRTADVPAHALFLAGVEGGFLSPETLLPLLALPGRLHHRAVTGERHTSQLGGNTTCFPPPPPPPPSSPPPSMSRGILDRRDPASDGG